MDRRMTILEAAAGAGDSGSVAAHRRGSDGAAIFSRIVDVLLADGPIGRRVAEAARCLDRFDRCPDISDGLRDDLRDLISDLSRTAQRGPTLSEEEEGALTERLLALYTEISGGILLW